MYPIKDRKDFIEIHRRSVIKLNLPISLVDDIEKKESLFSEYTSAELLEIIVSYLEYNELDNSQLDRSAESYQVYASQFNQQGTFRRDGIVNNFRQGSGKEGFDKQPGLRRVQQIQTIPVEPFTVEKIKTITSTPPPRNLKPPTKENSERSRILKECGIDITRDKVCYMCLGSHFRPHCGVYPREVEYGEMCRQTIDGEKYIFGFHPKSSCKHGNDISQGRKFTGSQSDNRDQQAPRYGQPFPNNNWKPYRG